jgi:putative ABC transport system substrate-binding protein
LPPSRAYRRNFLGAIAGCVVGATLGGCAPGAGKVWRIGFFRERYAAIADPFWDVLRGLGWIEGHNVVVEARFAGSPDELPDLAAELVRRKVDVIITQGPAAVRAAMQATRTIPILFWMTGDPVASGLVASFARPGGNVTGFFYGKYDAKMLDILKLCMPHVARIAVPVRANPELLEAAQQLGVQVSPIGVDAPEHFPRFYADAHALRADAVLVNYDVQWLNLNTGPLVREALKSRMPTIGESRWFVEEGGMLSYGPAPAHWVKLAALIDKIFKGTKPADIPVELPTKFELFINLKTADAMGVDIPNDVQVRADAVLR